MSGAAMGRRCARYSGSGGRFLHNGDCRIAMFAAVTAVGLVSYGLPITAQAAEPARAIVVTVAAGSIDEQGDVNLTGDIQAQTQSDLAFRIEGKVVTRTVEVGQHVLKGSVIATLDTRQEDADLRAAEAQLATAQAMNAPAVIEFQRQEKLLASGFTTRAKYDSAEESLRRTGADVISATASLATKRDELSYATLRASANGLIVARKAEIGQVVKAGQAVATLAEDGPRDAVFDVSEAMAVRPPVDAEVTVRLATVPGVTAHGKVRTVSPVVDSASSTLRVKIGLVDPLPPAMTLGATVIGSAVFAPTRVIRLPWSCLVTRDGAPAVWTVDAAGKVSSVPVHVLRYHTGNFDIASSLPNGVRIVSAGVQFLRPGQTVDVRAGPPP